MLKIQRHKAIGTFCFLSHLLTDLLIFLILPRVTLAFLVRNMYFKIFVDAFVSRKDLQFMHEIREHFIPIWKEKPSISVK